MAARCEVRDSGDHSSYTTAQDDRFLAEATREQSKDRPVSQEQRETSIAAPSDTASFLQRESELASIQKRFGDVLSRKKHTLPFTSRFREDLFQEDDTARPQKPPVIPQIYLTVPDRLNVPIRGQSEILVGSNNLVSGTLDLGSSRLQTGAHHRHKWYSTNNLRGDLKASAGGLYRRPDAEESATDLWQRAIRLEAERRRNGISRSDLQKSEQSVLSRPEKCRGALPPEDSAQVRYKHSQQAQISSYSDRKDPTKLRWTLVKAPASWARFAAHTREERNQHASIDDRVTSKDFALRALSSTGEPGWITDQADTLATDSMSYYRGSLPSRLSNAVKTRLARLFRREEEGAANLRDSLLTRRAAGSQFDEDAEYPEITVLPPGIGHIIEPEQVADAMTAKKASLASCSRNSLLGSQSKLHRQTTRRRTKSSEQTAGKRRATTSASQSDNLATGSRGYKSCRNLSRQRFVTMSNSEQTVSVGKLAPRLRSEGDLLRPFSWSGAPLVRRLSTGNLGAPTYELSVLQRGSKGVADSSETREAHGLKTSTKTIAT